MNRPSLLTLLAAHLLLFAVPSARADDPPPNDNFADRIPLSGCPAVAWGTTIGATKEPTDNGVCSYAASQNVWWNWTAPSNGEYAVVVASTNFSQILGVYSESSWPGVLLLLGCNVFSHSTPTNGGYRYCTQVNFQARAGTNYPIVVDSGGASRAGSFQLAVTKPPHASWISPAPRAIYNPPAPVNLEVTADDPDGSIQRVDYQWLGVGPGYSIGHPIGTAISPPWGMSWQTAPIGRYPIQASILDDLGACTVLTNLIWMGVAPPCNDDFVNRLTLPNTETNLSISASNNWASAEPGEPGGQHSVWWSWTAPAARLVTLNAWNGPFLPGIAIYTGGSVSNLNPVFNASSGPCTFSADAGVTYQIRVDAAAEDNFTLSLSTSPVPPVTLSVSPGTTVGTFRFLYAGVPGQLSVIELSTDLQSWIPITTNFYYGGFNQWVEPLQTNSGPRFFRVRQQSYR